MDTQCAELPFFVALEDACCLFELKRVVFLLMVRRCETDDVLCVFSVRLSVEQVFAS